MTFIANRMIIRTIQNSLVRQVMLYQTMPRNIRKDFSHAINRKLLFWNANW